jgi:hypothetical protein
MPACPPSPAHPGLPEQSRRKPGRAGYSYSSTCTPVLYCTGTATAVLYELPFSKKGAPGEPIVYRSYRFVSQYITSLFPRLKKKRKRESRGWI